MHARYLGFLSFLWYSIYIITRFRCKRYCVVTEAARRSTDRRSIAARIEFICSIVSRTVNRLKQPMDTYRMYISALSFYLWNENNETKETTRIFVTIGIRIFVWRFFRSISREKNTKTKLCHDVYNVNKIIIIYHKSRCGIFVIVVVAFSFAQRWLTIAKLVSREKNSYKNKCPRNFLALSIIFTEMLPFVFGIGAATRPRRDACIVSTHRGGNKKIERGDSGVAPPRHRRRYICQRTKS